MICRMEFFTSSTEGKPSVERLSDVAQVRLLIAVRDLIAPSAEFGRTAEIGLHSAICTRRDVFIHLEDTLSEHELHNRLVVAFAT